MLTPRTTCREPKLFSTLCTARNPGRRNNCGPDEPLALAGFATLADCLTDPVAGFGRGRGFSALGKSLCKSLDKSLGDSALGAGRSASPGMGAPRTAGGVSRTALANTVRGLASGEMSSRERANPALP